MILYQYLHGLSTLSFHQISLGDGEPDILRYAVGNRAVFQVIYQAMTKWDALLWNRPIGLAPYSLLSSFAPKCCFSCHLNDNGFVVS